EPIPFYGELSSLNPLVVSAGAVAARAENIAQGLVESVNTSAGQLCTKPGVAFVPRGEAGDQLVDAAAALVGNLDPAVLLNSRIRDEYREYSAGVDQWKGARVVATGRPATGDGAVVTPQLLEIDSDDLTGQEFSECFGPTVLIVRYAEPDL